MIFLKHFSNYKQWKLFFIAFFLCITTSSIAQKITYEYREAMNTLTSPRLFGRGYQYHGDAVAAEWLVRELRKMEIQPSFKKDFDKPSYLQNFTMPVHYFTSCDVKLSGKLLQTGVDYMPAADCPTNFGSYTCILKIDSASALNLGIVRNIIKTMKPNKPILLLPFKKAEKSARKIIDSLSAQIEGVLITQEKFTHTIDSRPLPIPLVYVKPAFVSALLKEGAVLNLAIATKTDAKYKTANVGAYMEGGVVDSLLIIGAHYDHLGIVGTAYFPGANDNASGTAMLLSLAKYFQENPDKRPCNMLFLWFAGEEAGLVGSKYYTENPCLPFTAKTRMLNLDLMAGGSEGLMLVNGKDDKLMTPRFTYYNDKNFLLPKISVRPNAPNSDHYWFTQKGVPAVFAYTQGDVKAYHDVNDTMKDLKLDRFEAVFKLLIQVITDGKP